MYFTRIEVDANRRASRRVLSSPHLLHGAVTSCFPRSVDPGRVLWRIDERPNGTYLYLLSGDEPDATGFVEEHGWPRAESWQPRPYQPVLDAIVDGRAFSFRLRANPVRNVRPDDGGDGRVRGKRVGHVTASQQLGWLHDRAGGWGFFLGDVDAATAQVVERRVWTFPRHGRRVTVAMATFEGVLTVTDSELLRSNLATGMGPAKAYGCGLMTLAPAPGP
jgi:CRISPR system Cascade subunit CasE